MSWVGETGTVQRGTIKLGFNLVNWWLDLDQSILRFYVEALAKAPGSTIIQSELKIQQCGSQHPGNGGVGNTGMFLDCGDSLTELKMVHHPRGS